MSESEDRRPKLIKVRVERARMGYRGASAESLQDGTVLCDHALVVALTDGPGDDVSVHVHSIDGSDGDTIDEAQLLVAWAALTEATFDIVSEGDGFEELKQDSETIRALVAAAKAIKDESAGIRDQVVELRKLN